ncbi:MAG: putative lipid II flippase FtsW [Patescibacteria group bacterium]|nr:putative lipid II flippase FtsW [Patescibacteria group bacterium]
MSVRGQRKHRPNFLLFASLIALILLGAILISSASVVLSNQVSGDPNFYFKEHLYALGAGFVLMFAGYKIDYSFWKKIAPILILAAVILLVLVFVPGIGYEHGGARRWIAWPFFFSPTEPFKLALIIYLAAWFAKRGSNVKKFFYSTLPFLVIIAITGALILFQPDMGTFMITAAIAGVMYFVAGANMSHVVAMVGAAIAGIIFLIKTAPYRMERFMIFLDPGADQGGAGYQINQALLAIGTGGLFGLGFGQSRQKFNYLPEASSDSIFAVAAEELGFLGASLVLLLFLVVAAVGYKVAKKAPDAFSRLLAVGITTWISLQAIVNIFAMLSLIPLTGVPLPFISTGSSSTLVLMLASGILLNISKHTEGETRESALRRRGNWWSYLTGPRNN